jgi:hypothetical protein
MFRSADQIVTSILRRVQMIRILKLQRLDVLAQDTLLGNSCSSSGGSCCNGQENR